MDAQEQVIDGDSGENLSIIPTISPDVTLDVFAGLSEAPVTKQQADILTAPADPNELDILPTGEVYPPQINVRRRLMKAFGPAGWGMRPLSGSKVKGNQVVQEWALYANGRYISYSMGGAEYQASNSRLNWSDAVESVKSNALVRLCKDLGMFPECWDRRWTEEWKRQYAVHVWVKDDKRPRWRRLDREPFYQETGLCEDSPNQKEYGDARRAAAASSKSTGVKPSDNGTQPKKTEPVKPTPPAPATTPAPVQSASKMLHVSEPAPADELEAHFGTPSITKQEANKTVKIWSGKEWLDKPADTFIMANSAQWFTKMFVGQGKAFEHQYALFGKPNSNNAGHLGKHYGRQNFVNPKDANDALTYREFSELVAYAWWKQGDKEHGTLSLPRYQEKIKEELDKQDAVPYDSATTPASTESGEVPPVAKIREVGATVGVSIDDLAQDVLEVNSLSIDDNDVTIAQRSALWNIVKFAQQNGNKATPYAEQKSLLRIELGLPDKE